MSNLDGKQVIQRYANWLSDYSKTDCHNNVWRIELPFMNRRRTHFQVFVEKTESGLMISDYGETIGDLRFSGFDIDTETRRRTLDGLLRSFSVELIGKGELRVYTSEEELPDYLNEMIHCMIAIDLMIYTAPHTVAQLYEEDTRAARNSKKKPLAATPS